MDDFAPRVGDFQAPESFLGHSSNSLIFPGASSKPDLEVTDVECLRQVFDLCGLSLQTPSRMLNQNSRDLCRQSRPQSVLGCRGGAYIFIILTCSYSCLGEAAEPPHSHSLSQNRFRSLKQHPSVTRARTKFAT